MRINDIFQEPIDHPIEAVVKVDQSDDEVVYDELRTFIPTDALQRHFRKILEAIVASRTEPTEGIGMWVSGSFGSGKSLFVKILGCILGQCTVKGQSASELFSSRLTDDRLKDIIKLVNRAIPFTVVMFDLAAESAVRTDRENISEVMYRVLLRTLACLRQL